MGVDRGGQGGLAPEVEAAQDRYHIVEGVRVLGVDPAAGLEEEVALGGVHRAVGAGGAAHWPGAPGVGVSQQGTLTWDNRPV